MSKVEDVHRLIKKYFWEMPDDASLSTGKIAFCLKRLLSFLKSMLNYLVLI